MNVGNTGRHRLDIFLTLFFGEHEAVLEFNSDRNRTTDVILIIIGLAHKTFTGR